MKKQELKQKLNNIKFIVISTIVVIATVLLCTLPMGLCPIWNGEIPDHRNQYELMADSILHGHVYFEYDDVDERLATMNNPYNPKERSALGVRYHWDHSYYNGKYYMYFGIAPCLLTFVPYKAITGHTLTTYHATQIFAAFFIVGMFMLLNNIRKYFYKEMHFGCYLGLAAALSIVSIWFSADQPAMYCTAIVSGLSMAVWSLYFFTKSVYGDYTINKAIIWATIGGLFGALTFACRPPVGLINFIMIPMLVAFFKKYGFNKSTILKVLIVFVPYLIVGSLLMAYNYIRFDNVFEFGQSYQLTLADQHNYLNILSRINISNIIKYIRVEFFDIGTFSNTFPFVGITGIFFNFPILLLPYFFIFDEKYRLQLKNKKLLVIYIMLMILPFAVAAFDAISAPIYGERYRMDEYYILAILTFIGIANYYSLRINNYKKKTLLQWLIIIFAIITILKAVLLFFVPRDSNYTDYYKDVNTKINDIIFFWK